MKEQQIAVEMADTRPEPSTGRLKFGEQFLIWSMRVWAQAHGGGQGHHHFAMLRKAYDLAGMPDGHVLFDSMMTAVVVSRRAQLGLHLPHCRGVSDDELLLLRLVAESQRGTLDDDLLLSVVARAGVDPVREACDAMAAALSTAGMTVRSLEVVNRQDDGEVAQAAEAEPTPRIVH